MKSFLDNLGVKRLTQNIRNWAESKFVDSDDYAYNPLEIDRLVINGKLKAGKIYKIHYTYDLNRTSFKSPYGRPSFIGVVEYLYLKAINRYTFDENAYLHPSISSSILIPIKFKYASYNEILQQTGRFCGVCRAILTDAEYRFASIINEGNNILFKREAGNPARPDQIIIDFSKILHNNVIEIDGVEYTIEYNGLGTITWMKDETGNETNFNNYILKNSIKPVQGLNNIVKSNIDFGSIKGNNNIIINSQNLNIEEDNLIYVNNVKQNTKQV